MTRVGIVTQARSTSTRLPGKVLMTVKGRSILAYHLTRLQAAGVPVYVATTGNETDDAIVEAASQVGVAGVARGDEHDVLRRYREAADQFGLDVIVRVTSDCPLIDGALIRAAVDAYLDDEPFENVYLSNTIDRTYPRGFDFEVFSAAALRRADEQAHRQAEREHVTPYLYSNSSAGVRLRSWTRTDDASRYRVTLDTPEDFRLIDTLIRQFGADELNCDQIVDVLRSHPALEALNAAVIQKPIFD